jgi:hypothetical protein
LKPSSKLSDRLGKTEDALNANAITYTLADGEVYAMTLDERVSAIQHALFLDRASEQAEVPPEAVGSSDSGRIHELFRMCV